MTGSQKGWTVRAFITNGCCPVDLFLENLEESDPTALLEFEAFLLPKLRAYGPTFGEPLILETRVPGLLCVCWGGKRGSYRIYLSIEEDHLIVMYAADDSSRPETFTQLAIACDHFTSYRDRR